MSKPLDMTKEKPLRLIVLFAYPLMLVGILQLSYTLVDSAVIGRLLGVNAFASVGATANPHWLVFDALMSTTHGFGAALAQRFGAKDYEGLNKTFSTAVIIAVTLGTAVGLAGVFGSKSVLVLLNTPPELLNDAALYLSFLLGGMPLTIFHNLLGAMLRAVGDSRTQLRAMIFSTLLNIVLDIALVIPLGIAGVAIATLLAQLAACVYCLRVIRKAGIIKKPERIWDTASAKELVRLGAPLGLVAAVTEIGALVVQRYINAYGVEFVAGMAAATRLYNLLVIIAGAIEGAVATFVAQNFGAKLIERVKLGVTVGRRLMFASSAIIMAFALLFGRGILSLLVEGEPEQLAAVLDAGQRQFMVFTLGLPVLCLLVLYKAALVGVGNTVIPMLSGFFEFTMRILSVMLLTSFLGVWGVHLAVASGWIAAAILLIISFNVIYGKLIRSS